MKLLLPLLTLSCFLWLATFSRADEHGYTVAQRASLNALLARELGQPSRKPGTRPSGLLIRQAAALQSLYGIEDAEIGKAVVLW